MSPEGSCDAPTRGEVWVVCCDPTVGSEYKKTRPAIVLNPSWTGRTNMRIAVPITGWDDRYISFPWMIRLAPTLSNGLTKESAADASQVRAVSVRRFVRKLGIVSDERLDETAAGVVLCVGHNP